MRKLPVLLGALGTSAIVTGYYLFAAATIVVLYNLALLLGFMPNVDLWIGAALACGMIIGIFSFPTISERVATSPTYLGW